MPPRKRARAAASSATIACDRSAIVLKQSAAIGAIYEAGEPGVPEAGRSGCHGKLFFR